MEKRYELDAKFLVRAEEYIPSHKGFGKPSTIALYYGKRVKGRKVLTLVKAGPHVDATDAKSAYYHTQQQRSGDTITTKYYELDEVDVYNRINHAKYHRLILQYSRMKLRDTAAFGLAPELAALTDKDIAKVLEFSRGELISVKGKFQY